MKNATIKDGFYPAQVIIKDGVLQKIEIVFKEEEKTYHCDVCGEDVTGNCWDFDREACKDCVTEKAVDEFQAKRDERSLKTKSCEGCGRTIEVDSEDNASSRYGHGEICSNCGVREALKGNFIRDEKRKEAYE